MTVSAGALLIGAFVVFAIGAVLPPVRAYTGTPREQLAAIGRHPLRWSAATVSIGIAVVLTVAGLSLLTSLLVAAGAAILPVLALVSFGFGAVLFAVELAFRASVTLTVATSAGEVPVWYDPMKEWAGALYRAYMPLGYLGLLALGIAILQTDVAHAGFGWLAAAVGGAGAVVHVAGRPRPLWDVVDLPGVHYLVTGALGIGLLIG